MHMLNLFNSFILVHIMSDLTYKYDRQIKTVKFFCFCFCQKKKGGGFDHG